MIVTLKAKLLSYWLYVFNEQMSEGDDDWQELTFSEALTNAHFRHWLSVWNEDSRGKLLQMIEGGNYANHS
jgi:hypothetical protein